MIYKKVLKLEPTHEKAAKNLRKVNKRRTKFQQATTLVTELEEISNSTEKQVSVERKEQTVALSQQGLFQPTMVAYSQNLAVSMGSERRKQSVIASEQGFFQPPIITVQEVVKLQQITKQESNFEENKIQTETSNIVAPQEMTSKNDLKTTKRLEASTSEDESDEAFEMTYVTSEEITFKSCVSIEESQSVLLAWGEKYSASNDTLLVYQQDTKEWFICGKNSEESVTNEKISSSSILGKMLHSKNREAAY